MEEQNEGQRWVRREGRSFPHGEGQVRAGRIGSHGEDTVSFLLLLLQGDSVSRRESRALCRPSPSHPHVGSIVAFLPLILRWKHSMSEYIRLILLHAWVCLPHSTASLVPLWWWWWWWLWHKKTSSVRLDTRFHLWDTSLGFLSICSLMSFVSS